MQPGGFKKLFVYLILTYLIGYTIFWIYYTLFTPENSDYYVFFTNTYGVMSLFGGFYGLYVSKKFGGLKSLYGKAILFLSLGLLFQELGQLAYMYYIYIKNIEIPYPSLGDVGFFGSVLFYILGSWNLFKMTGSSYSLAKSNMAKFEAILIAVALLAVTYLVLLRGYVYDSTSILKTALDLGYPFFQSIYVCLALITYTFSRYTLGGKITRYILYVIMALFLQYFSDFVFLYKTAQGTWFPGGMNDYMYFLSYFLMSWAIWKLDFFFDSVISEKGNNNAR